MNKISSLKQKFSKIEWYKQGGAVKPLYVSYPGRACLGFTMHQKRINMHYCPFGWYLYDDFFDVFFPKKNLERIAALYSAREMRSPGFIARLKKRWERKNIDPFLRSIHALEQTNLRRLSNSALQKRFTEFSLFYDAWWRESIFLDAFDVAGEDILHRALARESKTLTDRELSILTATTQWSWLQRERHALLRLAGDVMRTPRLKHAVLRTRSTASFGKTFPKFFQHVKEHSRTYHWIYNDYAVIRRIPWTRFFREIRELVKHPQQWREERKHLASVLRMERAKKRLARRRRLSSPPVRTAAMLTVLQEWRNMRKSMNQQGCAAAKLFAKEYARRTKLPLHAIEYMWWWEMKDVFTKQRVSKRERDARERGVFIFGQEDGTHHLFYGKDGKTLHHFMNQKIQSGSEVKGRAAYPGIVRGIARLVLAQNDFYKMKRGDILVAPNTRPEYVPIIKIAGAIISEEGGPTCHTAIVSRELKIPALVGVQGAIAVLKDGDRVEVDAIKGIVRKL